MTQLDKIVPTQKIGGRTGATEKIETNYRSDAILLFNVAKQRLFNINNWHKLCGKASAVFRLTDNQGNLIITRIPQVGDLIRIELPAPENKSGDGYDWVRIEKIEDERHPSKDEEVIGFRVRPVPNPKNSANEADAHFYTDEATSTFLVIRTKNIVVAMERGRNEKPNLKPGSFLNKLRNAGVAFAAMLGLSTPQWKSLVKGIIKGSS